MQQMSRRKEGSSKDEKTDRCQDRQFITVIYYLVNMNVIKMVFMVNSLKHALQLPRSSAMNNQDKSNSDGVGCHVLYGVLIPLYIVVGFSCLETKDSQGISRVLVYPVCPENSFTFLSTFCWWVLPSLYR